MPNQCCEHCAVVSNDHDLLLRMDTKLNSLIDMNGKHYEDHEKRIRRMERWFFGALGAMGLAQILIGIYVAIL